MLNRRKATDEQQTNFSPLIESILDDEKSEKEKGYENAGEVLKEGFSLFINNSKFEKYAGTISQTLDLVSFSAFYPVDVETALSVYFHMYVKNNNGYLYRLIQETF
jgi:hypothetical protein